MVYSAALGLCALLLIIIGENEVNGRFLLVPEDRELCLNRPRHWRWYNDTNADSVANNGEIIHNYFYSNDVREYKGQKYDWLAARNLCRQFCMDAVSIESFNENQMLYNFMDSRGLLNGRKERLTSEYGITRHSTNKHCGPNQPGQDPGYSYWIQCNADSDKHCCNRQGECSNNDFYGNDCGCLDCVDFKEAIEFFWTSGRKCDFSGCESRSDLEPLLVKGWFWSGSNQAIHDTNEIAPQWKYVPWGKTGHFERPQPDNAEMTVNSVPESCLAVAKDLYADGIQWHDISCYHPKPVICEDSDDLLKHLGITDTNDYYN